MTIGDCHEPPLIAVRPPHGEEHCNQSGISKTQLEDSEENEAFDPAFVVYLR